MTLPAWAMARSRSRSASRQATADLAVLATASAEQREQALQAFVGKYRKVALAYARKWKSREIDQADLDQEALIAFAEAARRYDGRAVGFWSFAHWRMRNALQNYVRQVAPLIPVGSRVQKNQRKIGRIAEGETDEQIAQRTGMSVDKVRLARAHWGGLRVVAFEEAHAARPRPEPATAEQRLAAAEASKPQPAAEPQNPSTSAADLIACALEQGATYREARDQVAAILRRAPSLRTVARLAGKLGLTRKRGRPATVGTAEQLARWVSDPAAVPQAWRGGRVSPTRMGKAIGCSRSTVWRAIGRPAPTGKR